MDQVIKELRGHSGSTVLLMKNTERYFIRKINNVQRNYERLSVLSSEYLVPKIYSYTNNILDMEYIHGLDMKTYLLHNQIDALVNYIIKILENLSKSTILKDYSETYHYKLQDFDKHKFSFTSKQLIEKLPTILPQSQYHGDFTLENILYSSSEFYLIDPMTTEYDSYVFDIAKLRQDITCKWFLRNEAIDIDVKLQNLEYKILEKFKVQVNDYLLVLMLYRVLNHCQLNDFNYLFLKENIEKIWANSKR